MSEKRLANPPCSPDEAQRNPGGSPGFRGVSSGLQATDAGFTTDIFQFAHHCFAQSLETLAAYDIQTAPELALRRGTGMLCHYSLKDGCIYFSPPDFSETTGKLHLLFLRSLLACDTDDEVFEIFYLLLPYVINHELGHHLRHHYGVFSENPWLEEQIADRFAGAMTKYRLSPARKQQARAYLQRAVESLSARLGREGFGAETYYDVWQSLEMGGHFHSASRTQIQLTEKLFAIDPLEVLETYHQRDMSAWQAKRTQGIETINHEYASDAMRYLYYQLYWMWMSFLSPEYHYLDSVAREYLPRRVALLPTLEPPAHPDDLAILACFKAYQDTTAYSAAAGRYFYKRYRALLLARLQAEPAQDNHLAEGYTFLLQHWQGDEQQPDMFDYVALLVPAALQSLFPHHIAGHPRLAAAAETHLPTATDQRLWRHVARQETDDAAAATLARLAALEQTEIYRALPAEVSLEIVHNICRVRLNAGEEIIWQGDRNRDVYILIRGELQAFITRNGTEQPLDKIHPGEVVGEMAFFTNNPRNTTVRAVSAAECFVLKECDLYLLGVKYPSILMEMAKTLAQRLADINQRG